MNKIIGIVGGVGPYAGLDLNKKIFDNIVASQDQDYPEVYLLSRSSVIPDRTAFLQNQDKLGNPAGPIAETINKLASIGATVIGVPCNTAHSPAIFNEAKAIALKTFPDIQIINMIESTRDFIIKHYPSMNKVGLLATLGSYSSGVYSKAFSSPGSPELIVPDSANQKLEHHSIYNTEYGVKAFSNPVKNEAVQDMLSVVNRLKEKGAELIIMGCTEIPLALNEVNCPIPLVDPTNILARSLIKAAAPKLLKAL